MTGRIYLLNDDGKELQPMEVALYESEKLLQELLSKYPDLLAGEQINSDSPRRWLLITPEMSVPDELDGGGRWSLDHLFIDQDAVPTLIEVKRSSDTRIRREVVGQMFDYAANAVAYWPVEELRAQFKSRCESSQQNPDDELLAFLGEGQDVEDFWLRVKTNLKAGRIRMVFVADEIPAELRRIVEFLNEQMDPAEILAVEVKQYVGKGMRTLVPRVLGQTEAARQNKSSGSERGRQWDKESFLKVIRDTKGEPAAAAAKSLLDWIKPDVVSIRWIQGSQSGMATLGVLYGESTYDICRMSTERGYVFRFDWLRKTPPFDDEAVCRVLLAKLNTIPGVHLEEDALARRPGIPFTALASHSGIETLKAILTWMVEQIRSQPNQRTTSNFVGHSAV